MRRLVLLAKRPRLGRVKTRLVPPLDPAAALALHRAFLVDLLGRLRDHAPAWDVEWCADAGEDPDLEVDLGTIAVREQAAGDLGSRLADVFRRAAEDGSTATVVVGADSPTLPRARIEEAFDALEAGVAVVSAPARDGGYVLIGLREPTPQLFEGIEWGGPRVFETTRRRADETGLGFRELDGWYDVDEIVGLRTLATELDAAPSRAPATWGVILDLRRRGML